MIPLIFFCFKRHKRDHDSIVYSSMNRNKIVILFWLLKFFILLLFLIIIFLFFINNFYYKEILNTIL